MIRLSGLPGSLRRGSYNRALLDAVRPLLPDDIDYRVFDGIADVPLYNEDIDRNPAPAAVIALREAVSHADGVFIASPEYNFSIPGVLKNALDWLSRPHGMGALRGKVVLAAVGTLSRSNGARALSDLNRVVSTMGNFVLYQPELVLAPAPSLLTRRRDGVVDIVDPVSRDLVRLAMDHLGGCLRSGVAVRNAQYLEASREILDHAKFAPFIREAITKGAPHEAIEDRLRNAGIDDSTARDWIAAEARPRDRIGGAV